MQKWDCGNLLNGPTYEAMPWANHRTHAERTILEQVVSIFRGMKTESLFM
jgi:hypothetical protein